MTLDEFRFNVAGTAVSFDGVEADKGQCVQLMERYMVDVLGVTPPLLPGAADYYEQGIDGFDKFGLVAGFPRKGDIVFFQRSVDSVGNNGHVSICYEDGNGSGYLGFDSNWDHTHFHDDKGFPTAHDVKHDYSKVTGYLRKKGQQMEQPTTYDEANSIYQNILRRNLSQKEWNDFEKGKTFRAVYDEVANSQEKKDRFAIEGRWEADSKTLNSNDAQKKIDEIKKIVN